MSVAAAKGGIGGAPAVRLNELQQLRPLAAPSAAQRERIAQLEVGEAVDTQAVARESSEQPKGEHLAGASAV
jgi:hypothetical protein